MQQVGNVLDGEDAWRCNRCRCLDICRSCMCGALEGTRECRAARTDPFGEAIE